MQMHIPTERECFPHQIGAPLAEGVVGTIHLARCAVPFGTRTMSRRRQYLLVDGILVGVKHAAFAIVSRQRLPERPAGRRRPVTDGPADDPLCRALDGDPVPDDLAFGAHIRPLLVNLDLRSDQGRQDGRPDGAEHFFSQPPDDRWAP